MVDRLTPNERSRNMARIRGKDTGPEMRVRKAAHAQGLRFRLHRRDLPGTPDLVFPGRRIALFVHGCFWHRHPGCLKAYTPRSRVDFWQAKFDANVARDARNMAALVKSGWTPVVIWECETTDAARLAAIIDERIKRDAETGAFAAFRPEHSGRPLKRIGGRRGHHQRAPLNRAGFAGGSKS